jgi:rhodanese-related sulfurtransferase
MDDKCQLTFQQRSLVQQGYEDFTQQQLKEMEWGLRFTPTLCALITLAGLILQQPAILFTVAVLGVWAFFFPASHPMDMIYNYGVRHLFGAAKIPANPFQRRLACLSAAGMNFAAGSLMLAGIPTAAWVVGGLLLVLQAIVIGTHFCMLSWMYEGALRMLGQWNFPIEETEAKQLLKQGATIVDVRSPQEFAQGHIESAINTPIETLPQAADQLPDGAKLIHCKSGMRSQLATKLLKKHGVTDVHNLGSLRRAQRIAAANRENEKAVTV